MGRYLYVGEQIKTKERKEKDNSLCDKFVLYAS